jgi:sugar phosphate isomerase/epimerase
LEKVGSRRHDCIHGRLPTQLYTPETYRATVRECASPLHSINYDPSHLLRMGIDPIRFLKEFAPRV